jgi:outer membrane protein TolC
MNKAHVRWCVLLTILLAGLAPAQDVFTRYWKNRFGANGIAQREIQGLDQRISNGKLHLRLPDFVALVLKNFADIQITRLEVYTAADQIVSAKSPFDPNLNLSFNAVRSVSPVGYALSGSPSGGEIALPQTINSLSQTSILDYTQLLPWGERFEATYTGLRSSGDGYPYPTLFGTLNFQLTQPLLQNRTNLQYLNPIRIARQELLITTKQSEAAIATAVAQAATQYWNAILSRETIRVDQQAVDLAQQSYKHDKLALDLGALSKLDIFQSETQVAERGRDLVQAQYEYKIQLDGLCRLIGADLTPRLRETELVLDDDPSVLPDSNNILPFEQAFAKALQARPEVAAADAAVSVDNLNAQASRDALLPRLDLSAQGGSSGPGYNQLTTGSVVGLTNAAPPPGLGTTLQQVLNFSYPTYGFSLTAQFPFHNSTAKANLADALVNRTRDQYRQRQIKEQIELDVRQATHSIELANVTIAAGIRARDLARQNLEAEQQKYQLGSITAFELLDAQSRLASTESALVTAYVGFQQAYVSYQRATWSLLDGFGVIVETPQVR